jgi:hypothetical protein
MSKKLILAALAAAVSFGSIGCASRTGEGALLGGAGGAAVGAGIGSLSHGRAGEGALLGAALGAIAGGAIGDSQDREEREYRSDRREVYREPRPRYVRREYYDDYAPRRPYRSYGRPDGYYEYRSYRTYDRYGRPRGYSESTYYYD